MIYKKGYLASILKSFVKAVKLMPELGEKKSIVTKDDIIFFYILKNL
jgi:hypothetical protein